MKNAAFSSFCLSFLFGFNTFAKVHTVNNNLQSPGQFTTIQAAHDAATTGDTILVAASTSAYVGPSFSKKICLIGAGMRPGEKKDNSSTSFLSSSISLNSGSDGSIIIGMQFNGNGVSARVNDVQILRNYFPSGSSLINIIGSLSNWIIANNYFVQNGCCGFILNGNGQAISNLLIQNNIFSDNSSCGCGAFVANGFGAAASCLFNNNLIYSNETNDGAFGTVNNFIMENNIFHTASPAGATGSVMNHNLTFGTTQNTMPYGNNTGSNNLANIDPQMESFSNTNKGPFQNFQPVAASPARTGGVGGTQMGVYGGSFNWANSAVPPIPVIKNFNLTSGATVPAGGSLNIKVTATKQN
jgi:hypothetical protein